MPYIIYKKLCKSLWHRRLRYRNNEKCSLIVSSIPFQRYVWYMLYRNLLVPVKSKLNTLLKHLLREIGRETILYSMNEGATLMILICEERNRESEREREKEDCKSFR